MRIRIFSLMLVALVLSACAPKKLGSNFRPILPVVRQTQLTAVNDWQLVGSFSLRQAQQSIVANYQWQQRDSRYDLHINSALNLFSIKIVGEPGQVNLWRSATNRVEASSPETLMQQELGWQLPLSKLQYWIRGLPAPGSYEAHYDQWGHIEVLEQDGWIIHYAHYVSYGSNDLPTLLRLEDGNWSAKILVKRWGF